MDINLNCNQIESLINFYVEGKLVPSLKECVDEHLKQCSKCRKKIEQLQKVLIEYNQKNNQEEEGSIDREFINSLSAYVDNELDTSENVKIKKMTISNPAARKTLESLYNYKKLLHAAYEKTKSNVKYDYSKDIVSVLNESFNYDTTYFRNIIIMIFFMLAAIACGFVYLNF